MGHVHKHSKSLLEALESRLLMTTLPDGFSESVIAGGLGAVTNMDVLPGGRVLVAEQTGKLELVQAKGGPAPPATPPTLALSLTVDSDGERGLIGVTHDPHFNLNHFIYLYHTVPASGSGAPFNEVTRYRMAGNTVVASSAVDILKLNDLSGATNHNGGSMHFGLDGKLYIDVGENANPANSQTLANLLGKILRIDVSRITPRDPINDTAKLIPHDNPFVNTAVGINQAIYALGLRNPFTFAVNPDHTIYINDVGQSTWEEIDQLHAGANYGWGVSEGFAGGTPSGLGPGTYFEPLLAYNHSGGPAGGGIAIIGGVLYQPPRGRGGALHPFPASFDGKYFYMDLGGDWMRVFDPSTPGSVATPDTSTGFASNTANNPVSMAMAPDGGIYYLAQDNGGELLKISSDPSILRQPKNATVRAGLSALFTVAANGSGPLTYQWQRDDGGGFVNISGATFNTFVLRHTQSSDNGAAFRVLITDANGTTTSARATVTVRTAST